MDASASFADLNDLTDGGEDFGADERPVPHYQPPQTGFQEFDFSTASPPLFSTRFAIDLAAVVGGDEAVMGFTAANGGSASRYEVHYFSYDGPYPGRDVVFVEDVYVRGTTWAGQDNNPATVTFTEYLEAKGLGDENHGYRLFGDGRTAPPSNPEDILPWINVDQIVVRFSEDYPFSDFPHFPGDFNVAGQKGGQFLVTRVDPVIGLPTAFVLTLDRPLGGGDPATGAAPTAAENGDHITLTIPSVGPGGSNFRLTMHVLQGDTDHLAEGTGHVVLARDYSEVKKKFFKSTLSEATGTDTDYSIFHDVDADGSILARDYSEVKKRFFHTLSTAPASPPVTPAAATAGALSLDSRVTRDLFGAETILA